MNVMDTFYRIPFSTLLAYIPVLATVVTCYFSVILARATLRYVAATDKGLALAREEFEREWSPELHLKLERISTTEARIVVTNLAKLSVLLQLLQIRKLTFLVPFERCVLNDPLLGGMSYTQDIGKRLDRQEFRENPHWARPLLEKMLYERLIWKDEGYYFYPTEEQKAIERQKKGGGRSVAV